MDVKSPAAADPISRPSSTPPPPARPSRVAVALRRTGIAVAGVGVAALTAAACVLSFDDLRALAVIGEADRSLAYLYPAAFDALLAIAMIGILLLRGGRRPVRLQAGVILTLLLVAAAAAEVVTALRIEVDVRRAAVVVAVAPWVTLALALWLWLLMIKHAAARRAAVDAATADHDRDIVPFPDADLPTAEYPARPAQAAHPVHTAHAAHTAHAVQHPAAEVVLDPQAAPPLESAPHHDLPPGVPVVGPTPAPETPEIDDLPEPPADSLPAAESAPEPAPEPVPGPTAEPEPEPEPVRAADKPLRWGDLVRPQRGDLLVHPPRAAVRQERETEVGDRDADTQPIRVMAGEASPDPAHGAEAADRQERTARTVSRSEPHAGDARGAGAEPHTGDIRDTEDAGSTAEVEPHTGDIRGTEDAGDAAEGAAGAEPHAEERAAQSESSAEDLTVSPPHTEDTGDTEGTTAQDASPQAEPAAQEPVRRPAKGSAKDPAKDPAKGSTKDPVEDSAEDPAEDPAEHSAATDATDRPGTHETAAPPSGRMRSTPVPPED
ncbi:DUF2637 domain-containing protein [Streptosporangium sp. CA-135522]|uniref:DUF2637 domain-containing protein n=1 Tax=Streptosporangium sp. CA-135522 TaxID=3240072 RepID=UPI003D91CAE3